MDKAKDIKVKLLGGVFFLGLFLLLNKSPLADSIQIKLVYSQMVIPFYQWTLILAFMVFWRQVTKEPWRMVLAKATILGIALCLYLPMLDTQLELWKNSPLSYIYSLYVYLLILLVTSILVFTGAVPLTAYFKKDDIYSNLILNDPMFFILFLLSGFGIYFYYLHGHIREGIFLSLVLISSPVVLSRAKSYSKIFTIIKDIFRYISEYKRLVAFIFLVSLVLRLIFFLNLLSIEGERYPFSSDDGDTYDAWGWRGVKDPMIYFRESPHYFWVFYSVLLTLIYSIFGHSYLAVGVIQSVIGALLCSLIFIFTFKLINNKIVAFLASFGAAIDSTLIFLTTTLNTEVLYIPLMFLVILLLLNYRETKNNRKAIVFLVFSSLCLGVATIIRTTGIGLIVFSLPWILIWGRGYSHKRFIKKLRDASIFFIITFITVSPITIINYNNTGRFFLVYDTRGSVEWKASVPDEDIVPSNKKFIALGIEDPINNPKGSIKAILRRPVDFIKVFFEIIPKRVRNLYFMPNFGYFDPIFLMNPARAPNRFASHLLFYNVLLFISAFFIFIFSRIKSYCKSLTLLVIAYYTLLHGVVFLAVGPRYGAPMRPFLNIIIAYGLYRLIKIIVYSKTT